MVILHVAPNGESESLGVSCSLEVGLQVQKCAVVLLIICAFGSHISLCFLPLPKGDAEAHLLLMGFSGMDDYRRRQELAYLFRL